MSALMENIPSSLVSDALGDGFWLGGGLVERGSGGGAAVPGALVGNFRAVPCAVLEADEPMDMTLESHPTLNMVVSRVVGVETAMSRC